jgi:hypothetical protein
MRLVKQQAHNFYAWSYCAADEKIMRVRFIAFFCKAPGPVIQNPVSLILGEIQSILPTSSLSMNLEIFFLEILPG